MEHLTAPLTEVKFANDGREFTGYGAVFGNVDLGGDVIERGAFRAAIDKASAGEWPDMHFNHDGILSMAAPIGVWTEMEENARGLKMSGVLAATEKAGEVYSLMKMTPRPAVSGLSIGYQATDVDREKGGVRRIKSLNLIEVSLVTRPMNARARVTSVKSALLGLSAKEFRDLEATLRDEGLSGSNAVKAVSGLKTWLQRDAEEPITDPRDEVDAALAGLLRRNLALTESWRS